MITNKGLKGTYMWPNGTNMGTVDDLHRACRDQYRASRDKYGACRDQHMGSVGDNVGPADGQMACRDQYGTCR